VQVANALVGQFAADARKDGLVPVIYIVNNLGFGDQLYQALATRLKADAIPYVSSHDFVDPRDPANYLPDTHFTDANDDKLARAIEEVIARSSMDKPRQGSERVPGEK
jgi:isopentenyl phosphate kinase